MSRRLHLLRPRDRPRCVISRSDEEGLGVPHGVVRRLASWAARALADRGPRSSPRDSEVSMRSAARGAVAACAPRRCGTLHRGVEIAGSRGRVPWRFRERRGGAYVGRGRCRRPSATETLACVAEARAVQQNTTRWGVREAAHPTGAEAGAGAHRVRRTMARGVRCADRSVAIRPTPASRMTSVSCATPSLHEMRH